MADKPIFAVDLDTSSFDAFKAKFDALQKKTSDSSSVWANALKPAEALGGQMERMAAALEKANAALGRMEQSQKDQADAAAQAAAEKAWGSVAVSIKHMSSSILDSSLRIAKWAGVTTALSAIFSGGGLVAFGNIANRVTRNRVSAFGQGISYGDAAAFNANYSRLGNASGLLSGFGSMLNTRSEAGPLYSVPGLNPDSDLKGMNSAQALNASLPKIKKWLEQQDPKTLGNLLEATGWAAKGLDLRTARSIIAMPWSEIEGMREGFARDTQAMNLPKEAAEAMADFERKVEISGSAISNAFAEGLSNLADPLDHLQEAFVHLVDHLLDDKDGPLKAWIDMAASGLTSFADKVDTPEFKSTAKGIMNDVTTLSNAVEAIASSSVWKALLWGYGMVGRGVDGLNYLSGADPNHNAGRDTRQWLDRQMNSIPRLPAPANPPDPNDPLSPEEAPRSDERGLAVHPPQASAPSPAPSPAPNTNAGGGGGGGADWSRVGIRPGRRPDLKDVDPRLIDTVNAAATHLPDGYKLNYSEGYNPHGHTAGSQHHVRGRGAVDTVIVDPNGKEIPNSGTDTTGLYTQLHRDAEGELKARYPDLYAAHQMGHGIDFGTVSGGSKPDLMHFDLGGARGRGYGGGQRIEQLGPRSGVNYGRKMPNHVEVHDQDGSGQVDVKTQSYGPKTPSQ